MFLPAEPCPARTQIQCRGSLKACLAFSCQIHRELNIQWLENSAAKISYVPYFFHRQRLGGAHARAFCTVPSAARPRLHRLGSAFPRLGRLPHAAPSRALRARVCTVSRAPPPPELAQLSCAPAHPHSPGLGEGGDAHVGHCGEVGCSCR